MTQAVSLDLVYGGATEDLLGTQFFGFHARRKTCDRKTFLDNVDAKQSESLIGLGDMYFAHEAATQGMRKAEHRGCLFTNVRDNAAVVPALDMLALD